MTTKTAATQWRRFQRELLRDLAKALADMYAKDFPFADPAEFGGGIKYVAENLGAEDWSNRAANAQVQAHNVLKRARDAGLLEE
jgi:hypothetical protein